MKTESPELRFFGGKGGVGKTTCAAAEALRIAETGRRVLVVSSDPAHSLGDALGVKLGAAARRVRTKRGELWAAELDADRALARWTGARERDFRTIASRGTYLDDEDVDALMRLSLPGVDELVGLVELRRLARATARPASGRRGQPPKPYDVVVVDTAPTGHTLRLLGMPDALRRIAEVLDGMQGKHRFLAQSLGGRYRADRADRVIDEIDEEGRALGEALRDPARTSFTWVVLPEPMALDETKDGLAHLEALGVRVREVRVNRVTPPPARRCGTCTGRVAMERRTIAEIARVAGERDVTTTWAAETEPRGVEALRRLAAARLPAPGSRLQAKKETPPRSAKLGGGSVTSALLDEVAPPGVRLVLVGGKGGVGKTTTAATIAIAAAERDPRRRVLLLSSDPAHSLGDVLGVPVGDEERAIPHAPPGLRARELDAERAFAERRERYRRGVDELFARVLRGSLDATFDRQVTMDLIDLAPPGLDELFAVLALTDALLGPRPAYDLVVLDTAPTGHTLRLLAMPDAALEWVRAILAILLKYRQVVGLGELAQDLVDASRDLKALAALLRDASRTRFVPVTRAEDVVRLETERLLRALRRRGVPVAPVLVNAMTAESRPCARCALATRAQKREIGLLRRASRAMLFAPAVFPPPRGPRDLAAWGATWKHA